MKNPSPRPKENPKSPEALRLWQQARLAYALYSEYACSNDPYNEALALSAYDLCQHSMERAKVASRTSTQPNK